MYFQQIFIGGYDNNLCYFLGADKSEVCVVDPVEIDDLLKIAENNNIGKISAILITHSHFDHISGTPKLLEKVGPIPVYIHECGLEAIPGATGIKDQDIVRETGLEIKVHHTPGHRFDSVLYEVDDNLITGDTLFVGGCGRCDLRGSDINDMYISLYEKLPKLDSNLKVWPGHDYGSTPSSTLEQEFCTNKFLTCSTKEEFLDLRG